MRGSSNTVQLPFLTNYDAQEGKLGHIIIIVLMSSSRTLPCSVGCPGSFVFAEVVKVLRVMCMEVASVGGCETNLLVLSITTKEPAIAPVISFSYYLVT
ncbi:hypothetical protein M405DRAFT_187979 [Rhizopogon salebrosus TDB-379]|nr:hypothetical protein M405DRAFT_187979 [Rhizopogon salebrosus TDB-379]